MWCGLIDVLGETNIWETTIKHFLINMIPNLLISIFIVYLTVRLSIRRFRNERWWERKADTYSSVMEALHHMRKYYIMEIKNLETDKELSKEEKQELLEKSQKSVEQISMAVDIGSFLISDEAVDCLNVLQNGLKEAWDNTHANIYDYFDSGYDNIETCIKSIRKIAKRDLCVD